VKEGKGWDDIPTPSFLSLVRRTTPYLVVIGYRSVINVRFNFQICCSCSKSGLVEGGLGRKLRPNFLLLTPVGVGEISDSVLSV